MSHMQNLDRRGKSGVYYARIYVPLDLQSAMGRDEIRPSLRTTDLAEAKRRLAALLDQWSATFDDMRRRQTLTDDDIQTAVWDHYSAGLAAGDAERMSRPTPSDIEAATDLALADQPRWEGVVASINAMTDVELLAGKATWATKRRAARLVRLRADLGAGDTRLIEPDADAFLTKHKFRIGRSDPRYRELCQKLMRAEIEQLERYAERDAGDFGGKPRDAVVHPPAVRPDEATEAGDSIMVMFGRYERENPNDIQPDSMRQARRDVQNFAAFAGSRTRVRKISKALVRDWKDMLADYPVKASETSIFKGKSPSEIVAANQALPSPKPTLTRQTVRRYMASLGGFCRWLVKHDYLDANPVTDMLPKKIGPTNKRATFQDPALKTLFNSPLFSSASSAEWRGLDKPGNVAVRDHRYWIPWVMLHSGARPAEVAQLHVADVREEHGIWLMHISDDDGTGKRTKTAGSRRVVPIHSALIDLGFLKHVERQRASGETQVFPEIELPKDGQIAAQFSREFNRYLTKIGVKAGRDIVLYSLRHTFVDRARRGGFMDDEIATVVGHETGVSKRTMTSGYGVEQHGTLKRRQEIVEAVRYALT